jgi:hypothetical protein
MDAPKPVMSSMWRDTIPFAEVGVPELTHGSSFPTGGRDEYFVELDDFVDAAKVYARLAHDICQRRRKP